MRNVETKHILELTNTEIDMLLNALIHECKCRGEQITELEHYVSDTSNPNAQNDAIKRSELIKEFQPYKDLRNEIGALTGTHFMGNDY